MMFSISPPTVALQSCVDLTPTAAATGPARHQLHAGSKKHRRSPSHELALELLNMSSGIDFSESLEADLYHTTKRQAAIYSSTPCSNVSPRSCAAARVLEATSMQTSASATLHSKRTHSPPDSKPSTPMRSVLARPLPVLPQLAQRLRPTQCLL